MKNLAAFLLTLFFVCSNFGQTTKAFEIKVIGKGQPILLIPGYSCSGEVWNETVEHLKSNYELHVLTLAGFATAQPIDEEEILKTVRNQIIQYVKKQKLQKPILIGHSLGAFMTLWLQSTEPDLFGKSICVDGVPFISALYNPLTTAESIKKDPQFDKAKVIENFKNLPTEGYIENTTKAMAYQVSDSVRARQIAHWSFQSDRRTLGSTIVEMSTTDLRAELSKIKQNILVLASILGTKENSTKIYNEQYELLKNKTIVIADSKHFIMYDQPKWFYAQIDAFLKSN
ncbi:alpha/beta hydrolase [Flavobacterium sp.]|uniref:alpha/beta fold hydrolase n=1 Tax=Flavobacterium sp. TaxID=239 RepID=UPI0026335730|nr:alpha/beta hydrolase [Flavobacterium sp.]MDD3004936.1 alpha/beta hydrolase [Flavobacterium sp.]